MLLCTVSKYGQLDADRLTHLSNDQIEVGLCWSLLHMQPLNSYQAACVYMYMYMCVDVDLCTTLGVCMCVCGRKR